MTFGQRVTLARRTGAFECLFVLFFLATFQALAASGLHAQEEWTIEFSGTGMTFQAESQPVSVREAMGAILVTTDAFRLLTDLADAGLVGCTSSRPDLPDARVQPAEVADRVGSLSLAVFEDDQVNFTFRTMDEGPEYALMMNDPTADQMQVTRGDAGELVLSGTGTALTVVRNSAESFYCAEVADFTIKLTP